MAIKLIAKFNNIFIGHLVLKHTLLLMVMDMGPNEGQASENDSSRMKGNFHVKFAVIS